MCVSILVLMEEALRHHIYNSSRHCTNDVSILVLMEEALRHIFVRCYIFVINVSILVLMEEALRLHTDLKTLLCMGLVSILVLMEEALRRQQLSMSILQLQRFNPCFNGRGVKTNGHPYLPEYVF